MVGRMITFLLEFLVIFEFDTNFRDNLQVLIEGQAELGVVVNLVRIGYPERGILSHHFDTEIFAASEINTSYFLLFLSIILQVLT
jgi:hypothetical protein